MRYLISCFLFCLAAAAGAQPVVQVDPGDEMTSLARDAFFLEDTGGQLTLAQVQEAGPAQRFRPVAAQMINFGITESAFWIRSRLRNNTGEKLLIEVGNNALSQIEVYELKNGALAKKYVTGNWMPFAKREIKNVNYLFPLTIGYGEEATVYLRVQHSRGTQFRLKAGSLVAYYEMGTRRSLLEGMYYGFMLLMVLYNFFLFVSLRDPAYLYYVVYIFFMALLNASINGFAFRFLWPGYPVINRYDDIIGALAGCAGILFAARFLNTKKNTPFFHRVFLALFVIYVADIILILLGFFKTGVLVLEINSLLLVLSFFAAAWQTMRNGYRPARFFLIAWSFLLVSVIVFILNNFTVIPTTTFATHSIQIGSAVEAMLLSMALANRIRVYKKQKREAQQAVLRSLEKNKKLIVEQNMVLEKKVAERTAELERANADLVLAMQNLKEAQTQLVQREKMASLGELTAGIAHEIQNPLNFVNNFSEVSNELADELQTELKNGQVQQAGSLASDLKDNLLRILHHGRRADSIVKGMLEHSRIKTARREPAFLNEIVDESLRLSYHAVLAADYSFSATLESHFDESVGAVPVVAQDIGRVFLNIFNNAFYSMKEKAKLQAGYHPVLSVFTKRENGMAKVWVRDNGIGIPPVVKEKIYQPFFTTKPAGEGTGLGLSLSYDIVTRQHGGSLQVNTREGEFAEFIIQLPTRPVES